MIDASLVRVPGRAPKWIVPAVKVGLVVADALAAALSFILAFYVRERASVFAPGATLAWSNRFAPYAALLLFVVCIRLLSFRYCDLYRVRGEFSFVDDGIRIFKDACGLNQRNGEWIVLLPAEGLCQYEVPGTLAEGVSLILAAYHEHRKTGGMFKDACKRVLKGADQYLIGRSMAGV